MILAEEMKKAFNFLESKKTPSNSFDLISKEISQYSVVNRGTFLLAFSRFGSDYSLITGGFINSLFCSI